MGPESASKRIVNKINDLRALRFLERRIGPRLAPRAPQAGFCA
jgi:hypothetical protein